MIDLEKQYRTEAGYEVKLSFIDGETVYGHFECWKDSWFGGEWNINDGIYSKTGSPECDLVEAKPRIKRTVWLNVYEDFTSIHSRRDIADMNAHDNRIACVKVEIDCKEGKGL